MVPTTLITPLEAEQAIHAQIRPLPLVSLPLRQCVGATLRESIYAERDQPPFDRAAMDGIAIRSEALARGIRRFRIQGTQAAGEPPLALADHDCAIEIMTGAMLPSGCDCIIPVEQLRLSPGIAELSAPITDTAYQFVHRRGSDASSGTLLVKAGCLLRAPEIAVAASAGLSQLRVTRQPRIMVVSTGNELIEPGDSIADFQVRRSNVYAVSAALLRRGFLHVSDDHASDHEDDLHRRLTQHLSTNDVLLLSGGVSMGKFDLVPKVLRQLGVKEVFHRVAQRPGKPMWFGVGPSGQAVFGLPGNPVSTLVCLIRYVIPSLTLAMGRQPNLPPAISLAAPFESQLTIALFLPVAVTTDAVGMAWAIPKPTNGSGDFVSLTASDGFIELPAGPAAFPHAFAAKLYRW